MDGLHKYLLNYGWLTQVSVKLWMVPQVPVKLWMAYPSICKIMDDLHKDLLNYG